MNLPPPLRLLQQPRRVSFTLPMSAHQLSMADQRDDAAAPRLGSPAPQAMQQLQDGRRVRVPVDDVAQQHQHVRVLLLPTVRFRVQHLGGARDVA